MITIKSTIKELLAKKNWTKQRLIGEIDMTVNGYENMFTNQSLKLRTIKLISEVLDVSMLDVLGPWIEECETNAVQMAKPTRESTQFISMALEYNEHLKKENAELRERNKMLETKLKKYEN